MGLRVCTLPQRKTFAWEGSKLNRKIGGLIPAEAAIAIAKTLR
jgi:hypothetical protein